MSTSRSVSEISSSMPSAVEALIEEINFQRAKELRQCLKDGE